MVRNPPRKLQAVQACLLQQQEQEQSRHHVSLRPRGVLILYARIVGSLSVQIQRQSLSRL